MPKQHSPASINHTKGRSIQENTASKGVQQPAVVPVPDKSVAQPVVQRVMIYPDALLQTALHMPQVIDTKTQTKGELEALYDHLTTISETQTDLVAYDQRAAFQVKINSVTAKLLTAILGKDYKRKSASTSKLVLSATQIEQAKEKAPRPTDLQYSGHYSMHHKIPRHVLEQWFERAINEGNLELLEKMAIISNRPDQNYLVSTEGGFTVTDMRTFKSHATHPRWDLFEGPLSDNREDDAHEKPDAHYDSDGSKTPRSTIAHQILDTGIDNISKGTLEELMQALRDKGLDKESPVVRTEWRNDAGEEWGRGPKYQWNDPQNKAVKENIETAKKRRAEEKREKAGRSGMASILATLRQGPTTSAPQSQPPKPFQLPPQSSLQPSLPSQQPGASATHLTEKDLGKILNKLKAPSNKPASEWKKMGHTARAKFYLANAQHFTDNALAEALEGAKAQITPGSWDVSDVQVGMVLLNDK